MASIADFKTNENLETEGAWVELSNGGQVKVARLGNPESERLYTRLAKPYANRRNGVPKDKLKEIMVQVALDAILKDWRNFTDADGNEVPYSRERAAEWLEIRDFREEVLEAAGYKETFQREHVEAASGN